VRLRFCGRDISIEEKLEFPLVGETIHRESITYKALSQNKIQMIIKSITPIVKEGIFVALEFEVEQLKILYKEEHDDDDDDEEEEEETPRQERYKVANPEQCSDLLV